jgi:excisionase family DNA binding protein
MSKIAAERMLTPSEVAQLFGVDTKTVVRWADAGKLSAIRTLGGHRRFKAEEVTRLLSGSVPAQRRPLAVASEAWRDLAASLPDRSDDRS